MDKATVREFFDAWSVYDRVLDHGYMFHDELYAEVARRLAERFAGRPFALVDLGCGSARHLAPVLARLPVRAYAGYDLSEVALAHAAENLSGLSCPVVLHQGDLLEGLREARGFDVVFSSFALHHFTAADKQVFFDAAHDALAPGGLLLLIDTTRDEGEDRDRYLDRYTAWLRSEWTAIPEAARDDISAHVRGFDFPEPVSVLEGMARAAGLGPCAAPSRFGWHALLCFEKPAGA